MGFSSDLLKKGLFLSVAASQYRKRSEESYRTSGKQKVKMLPMFVLFGNIFSSVSSFYQSSKLCSSSYSNICIRDFKQADGYSYIKESKPTDYYMLLHGFVYSLEDNSSPF